MQAFDSPKPFASPSEAGAPALAVSELQIEGYEKPITLRLYRPTRNTALPVVLYFHGGGFVRGALDDADFAARFLAEQLPALVVSVGYSLAPRHPFPAAPEDAYCAARWIESHARMHGGDPKRLFVAGHDAGGQIANCLAFMARDRGDVRIAAQALIGPMLDPSLTRLGDAAQLASDRTASDCGACWRAYLPQASQRIHPYAAPLEASRLVGLPGTLIITAQNDLLHLEAEKYAGNLIGAGVLTQVTRFRSVSHRELAQHVPALREIVGFFRCRLDSRAAR